MISKGVSELYAHFFFQTAEVESWYADSISEIKSGNHNTCLGVTDT